MPELCKHSCHPHMTSRRVARDRMTDDVGQLGILCWLLGCCLITGCNYKNRLRAETESNNVVVFVRVNERH
jgi:hypothetical protein